MGAPASSRQSQPIAVPYRIQRHSAFQPGGPRADPSRIAAIIPVAAEDEGAKLMTSLKGRGRMFRRAMAAAALAAGAVSLSGNAFAGECPGDKRIKDHTRPVTHAAKDVTDKVIGMIDLSKESSTGIKDRAFRLRKLEVKPGGIVPWHSHGDRPAIIYIVSGEITEYASNCAVPILHKAGDVAVETHVTSHWWKNTGAADVVLLSADLLRDPNDKHM
jgi:quercetin dioxygenase-like cupin family protein